MDKCVHHTRHVPQDGPGSAEEKGHHKLLFAESVGPLIELGQHAEKECRADTDNRDWQQAATPLMKRQPPTGARGGRQ